MAETTTYWVCSCGRAVDRGVAVCPECGKRRPWRKKLAVIVGLGMAGVFYLASIGSDPAKLPYTSADSGLNNEIAIWQSRIVEAPNPQAVRTLLTERDVALASKYAADGATYTSSGIVSGIAAMQDGGGLSVTMGSVTLTAGVVLSSGLDTLVKPGTGPHDALLLLKSGDKIEFSGSFAKNKSGGLVSLNYSNSNDINKPNFLFRFTEIKVQSR